MTPAQHTPGPWTVVDDPRPVRHGDGARFIGTEGHGNVAIVAGGTVTALANARLIAAAPDLLAACEAMLSAHGNCGSLREQRAADLCTAAIARATGGAS